MEALRLLPFFATTPVCLKKNPHIKGIYSPVSILPVLVELMKNIYIVKYINVFMKVLSNHAQKMHRKILHK